MADELTFELEGVNVEASSHSPYIGDNGNWYEWGNLQMTYVDSGIHAKGDTGDTGPQGEKGDTGEKGETGPAGGLYYPEFDIDPTTGELIVSGNDMSGLDFEINEETGDLEVNLT